MSTTYICKWKSSVIAALVVMLAIVALPTSRARAAGLLIADGGLGGVLEIKEHDVRVTINNGVAVTQVNQVFVNTEDRQVEALYSFPVPRGASVANFSMWINGKEMTGEVVEKQRAREIYNSYKQVRRDPGLLEQTSYRTFEMRIFPIAPRAEQRVQIAYYQELDFDHDWAGYVYPLATTAVQGLSTTRSEKFTMHVDVKSEVPIAGIESPSHAGDFAFAQHGENYNEASLEVSGADLNRDVVLAYQVSRPRTGIDVIASRASDSRDDGYFCLTLTAGDELPQKDAAMDYVFVLDVSGSMNDDGKLQVSQRSVDAFVDALSPQDRFELIVFNVQAATAFGELRAADEAARQQAETFLMSQTARGGTVLKPAVQAAYRYAAVDRALNVVILSDGLTEQTERRELIQLIGRRPEGSRVFCIGVGNDVNRALLEQLAADSGGLAAFVSQEDNFERQAAAFRRKLLRPVAGNLKITFDGGEVYDVEPRQLPNLYHGMPVRLYGRYRKPGNVKVNVAGDVLGQGLAKSVEIELPRGDDSNPEIERMWAWHRVDALLKQADADGSRSSAAPEIVRLGERYSIVTEYTSFIVLENDAEYQRWKIERNNELRTARDRAAQENLAAKLQALRERAAQNLGPASTDEPGAAAGADPVRLASATPAPSTPADRSPDSPNGPSDRPRSRDLDFGGGGGGGGAMGPFGALTILAGLAWVGATLRRRPEEDRR